MQLQSSQPGRTRIRGGSATATGDHGGRMRPNDDAAIDSSADAAADTTTTTLPLPVPVPSTRSPVSLRAMRDLLAIAASNEPMATDAAAAATAMSDGVPAASFGASIRMEERRASHDAALQLAMGMADAKLAQEGGDVELSAMESDGADASAAPELRARVRAAEVDQQTLLLKIQHLQGGLQAANNKLAHQNKQRHTNENEKVEADSAVTEEQPTQTAAAADAVPAPPAEPTSTSLVSTESGALASSSPPAASSSETSRAAAAAPPSSSPHSSPVATRSQQSKQQQQTAALLVKRVSNATSKALHVVTAHVNAAVSGRTLRARPPKKETKPAAKQEEEEEEEEEAEADEDAERTEEDEDEDEDEEADEPELDDDKDEDYGAPSRRSSAARIRNVRGAGASSRTTETATTTTASGRRIPPKPSLPQPVKASRTKVNPHIDQRPAYIQYVVVNQQFTLSREEVQGMSIAERKRKMVIPIRWLCSAKKYRKDGSMKPPNIRDFFVVAKDIATLIHKRRGSIAKAIASFHPLLEKGRVRVYGCRSPGKPGTQLLTVLTMRGVERLMRRSRYSRAMEVCRWTLKMAHTLCAAVAAKESGCSEDHLPEGVSPSLLRDVCKRDIRPEEVEMVTLEEFEQRHDEPPEVVLKASAGRDDDEEEEEEEDAEDDDAMPMDEADEREIAEAERAAATISRARPSPSPSPQEEDEEEEAAPSRPHRPSASPPHNKKPTSKNKTRSKQQQQAPRKSQPVEPEVDRTAELQAAAKQSAAVAAKEAAAERDRERRRLRRREKAREAKAAAAAAVTTAEGAQVTSVQQAAAPTSQPTKLLGKKRGQSPAVATLQSARASPSASPPDASPAPKRAKKEASSPPAQQQPQQQQQQQQPQPVLAPIPSTPALTLPVCGPLSVHHTPESTPRLTPLTLSASSSTSAYSTPLFQHSMLTPTGLSSFPLSRDITPVSSRQTSPLPLHMHGMLATKPKLRMSSNPAEMADLSALGFNMSPRAGANSNVPPQYPPQQHQQQQYQLQLQMQQQQQQQHQQPHQSFGLSFQQHPPAHPYSQPTFAHGMAAAHLGGYPSVLSPSNFHSASFFSPSNAIVKATTVATMPQQGQGQAFFGPSFSPRALTFGQPTAAAATTSMQRRTTNFQQQQHQQHQQSLFNHQLQQQQQQASYLLNQQLQSLSKDPHSSSASSAAGSPMVSPTGSPLAVDGPNTSTSAPVTPTAASPQEHMMIAPSVAQA